MDRDKENITFFVSLDLHHLFERGVSINFVVCISSEVKTWKTKIKRGNKFVSEI